MRLRDILTGNTKHVIDEAALPPSPAALYYFLDDQDSQRVSKWNPKGVGRPRFNAFNRQVTELLRDPFVVANMLAALKMVSDRGPVVESAPDSGDPARAPRGRPPKRRLETEDPAMKLMQEQVERAEAKNAALEKEKAALADELRDAEATAAAKADGISSVTLDAALKAIRDALDRAKLQSEQASRNIDLIVGVDSSDLSMAELGVLSKVGDLVHLSAEVLDAAVASAPGLAQQLDELVATPRAKPELALIKRRRVFLKLLEVAKVRRTKGGVENVLPRHAAVTAMATGATAASVETRRGCMGDTISFAETWRFLTVAGRLAKVAYPGLFPGRRVAFADDNAQWTRLWAQQRLEHFNSFETNPLLQSWFAIVWPLQTLPLEKTLRELGVRSKPFVEVRAADFDIDAHSQPWLAKELAVLSVDGGYGRDLLKRTLYKLVWRHDPGAFPPAVFKKPRWTDACKYRPEGPLQLEEDWKKDDVKSLEVQLKNTQKVPEVAEARLQVLDWFGIGCGDPGKDWVICVGDYVLYRNGTNAAGMTVADLSRLQDKRVVRTTAQLVALEAAETAAATPLAGPTGDAAAASTTVSAQPAAATRSTAVPATSTARPSRRRRRPPRTGLATESLDAFLATNPSSKQVQEACMAWGFGRNEDVTQYKRAAKLDHGTGMTICRLARLNGINLLKYLVENIDELCFASRDYSPLVVPPDIAATAESLEPARKSRPTASTAGDAVAHVNCVGQRSRGDHLCDECAETPWRAPPRPTSTLLSMRVIRKMVDDDVQLTVLRENPKGGKSRDRYEAYKVATSAAEFQRLGGSAEDLRNDLVRGYVTLGGEAAKDPATSTRTGPRRDGSTTSRRASPRRASRPTTAEARRRPAAATAAAATAPRRGGGGDGGFDAAYPELLRIHNLPGFWHLLEAGGIKVIFKLYYKSLLGRCAHDVLKRKGITIKAAKFLQATELFYHVWEAMATALFRAHRKSQTFRESPVDLATPELYMDNFLEWYRAKRGTGDVPFVHYGGFVFGMGIYFRFCKKSISLKLPMLTFALQLIHLGACDITNKYNLKRQCFYSLVNFLTSSEDVAKGLLAASTVSLSGRQHHAVSSDAAQEIKQGEIQKSMGPKFGVAKVLIHSALNDLLSGVAKSFAAIATGDASAAAAGGRSKNAQADIAALVAHFEAHDIFNYEGPARTSLPAGLTSKDYALPKGCVAPLDFTAPLDRQHQPVLERAFVAATELLTQAGLHQADEPVELAVPALRDDDDLSADGDESVSSQYTDAEPEVDESDSDDDDARLRADAEAREAGDKRLFSSPGPIQIRPWDTREPVFGVSGYARMAIQVDLRRI
ncbi:hypothetical protein JL720_11857 [Aureococcus anophagefferens]|nr:hypothetical protein JL720_11857 [Aureococcus anophagefferens]